MAFAAGAPPWWQARVALLAAALPLIALLAVRRHRTELIGYAAIGAALAVTVPGLVPLVGAGDEPVALYAALAALGVTLAARWGKTVAGDQPDGLRGCKGRRWPATDPTVRGRSRGRRWPASASWAWCRC
ncbi:hypothetical protein GCM10027614_61720 [Micromonospora vulcania]